MTVSTSSVRDLVERAVQGRLDIPEFQRGFVWRPDQVVALVDSLFRDYPVGQILTWENPAYASSRSAVTAQVPKRWLVDGQQRTTALCLVFGRKPYWWNDANDWNRRMGSTEVLANVGSEPSAVEFGLSNPVRAADPKWVSVREILSVESANGAAAATAELDRKAALIFQKLPSAVSSRLSLDKVRVLLRTVRDIGEREITFSDVRHNVEDVAEIFARLNQQGTEVAESDVSLAVASTLHPGWVREEFLPFLRNLSDSGFELEPGVVLRILTATGSGKVRLNDVSREFWQGAEFVGAWTETKRALSAVVSDLIGVKILAARLIPSHNALVPLAVLRARFGTRGFQFPRALHWFLMANRDGRYSGASSTALSEDVRKIRASDNFAEAVESLRDNLEVEVRVRPEEFLERHNWNRPLLLATYLTFVRNGAVDWVTKQPLGGLRADRAPDYGFEPHWHPFFPTGRSVLRAVRFDFTEDEVGALANLVVLNQKPPDRAWTTSPPTKYIPTAPVSAAELRQQMIPSDRALWEPDRYRDFLAERSKALAKAVNDYLASLVGSAR